MARRRYGPPLGEEQVRVTVRLPKKLYDDLAQRGRQGTFDRYRMLGTVIRHALTHYLACPHGLAKGRPRLEGLMEAMDKLAEQPPDAPPPPRAPTVPPWKLGVVSGALKLWHTQHPDTPPTREAIQACCGIPLGTEEFDAILDALTHSGEQEVSHG